MASYAFLVAVGFGLLLTVAEAKKNKIPNYIQICKKNDVHLEDCILNSIERIRPNLKAGIPELNVPSIEPLIIPELVVSPGGRFRAIGHNVTIFGAGDFKVTKLRVNLDKHEFHVGITIPEMYFVADYDVDAQILLLTLKGRGPLTANATQCSGDVLLKAQLVKKKGETYLHFYNIEIGLTLGKTRIHLDNLFNGDKTLSDATNTALNENSEEFIAAVKPIAEGVIAKFLLETSNKITEQFTYDELFPAE
ncbi:protein takeout [Anabrus simplex]|uniref:protein takeout n=1 Tax=Anabrus simplex TaxID=316456 RepID=UPI0035A3242A